MSTSPVSQNVVRRFGRKWEVKVRVPGQWLTLSTSNPAAAQNKDQTPLRVKFDIWQPANYGAFWYGNISVYNLSADTQQTLISEGMEVIVNAGYENGPYGEVFRGPVFQPMWARDNVIDYVTTLRCFLGREVLAETMIIMNRAAFATQDDIVQQMAANAITPSTYDQNGVRTPIKFGVDVSPELAKTKLERGKTFFCTPRKILDQVSRDNYLQWWYGSDGNVHAQDLTKNPDPNALVFTPDTGLVGTPQQTQEGVDFRLLLDPRVVVKYPAMQIKLNMSAIRQLERFVGQKPTYLDQDSTYIVAGVRHIGDSRGTEWYTEVIGVNSHYGTISLLTGLPQTPSTPIDVNKQ